MEKNSFDISKNIEVIVDCFSGKNYWETIPSYDLNLNGMYLADGGHGIRKQMVEASKLGLKKGYPATVFPSGTALASTFNYELVYEVGACIAEEATYYKVNVVLAPSMNIKRNPLCGRNFEYFSEDPYLTGKLAGALAKGIESKGIASCLKHYCLNNQETNRFNSNVLVDKKALNDIYLLPFKIAIKEGNPSCVMTSYNSFNGEHVNESTYLMLTKLRNEFNFKGKKHSKESKEKQRLKKIGKYIGKNNPMYGKSCTDYMDDNKIALWKLHISESVKGKNNPMYGKDWRIGKTKEEILSHNNNIKNTFANKTKEEKAEISRKISESQKRLKELDPVKYREQKAKAGRISVKNQSMYKINKIEKKVYDWLLEHNIAFEYSCIMGDGINNYQYDFIIKNKRILIEVQGDYWHGNPMFFNKEGSDNKRKLNDIQIKKKNYDILKYNFSIEKNFKLLYIWEYDINNDDFSALKELLDENKTT